MELDEMKSNLDDLMRSVKEKAVRLKAELDQARLHSQALTDLCQDLKKVKIQIPPKMRELSSTMSLIQNTSADRKVIRDYALEIAKAIHADDMASARAPLGEHVSVEFDETTDGMRAQQLLICAHWIDPKKGLQKRVVAVLNVSEPGQTTGEALAKRIAEALSKAGIWDRLDWIATDGASNVCMYRTSGATSSASKFMTDALQLIEKSARPWWCVLHRLNLAIKDMLREPALRNAVKILRRLVRWVRASVKRSSQVQGEVAATRELVQQLETALADLQQRIQANLANEDDVKELEEEEEETKQKLADFNEILKTLGKKRGLHSFLCVRWLSLFECVESVIAMWPFIEPTLRNAQKKKKKAHARSVDDSEESDSSEDEKRPDNKTDPQQLLQDVRGILHVLYFLSDLGKIYVPLVKEFQTTKTTINHIAFERLHLLMTKLFNVALRFPRPMDLVPCVLL
jgi:hypothetical protein